MRIGVPRATNVFVSCMLYDTSIKGFFRTMVKNRVRALLCQHGVEPPVSDLFGKKGLAWLKEEPELPAPDE